MSALPLRDELPFRNLERAVKRMDAARREIDAARAELDLICSSMGSVGLVVRIVADDDVTFGGPPLMVVES